MMKEFKLRCCGKRRRKQMKTHVIALTETTSRFDKEQNDTDEYYRSFNEWYNSREIVSGSLIYQERIDRHEKQRLQYQQKLESS